MDLASHLNNRNVAFASVLFVLVFTFIACLIGWGMEKTIAEADKDWDKTLKFSSENAEEFPYAVKTQQGGLFAEGEIVPASDLLTNDRLSGEYMAIRESFERYTMHTETYSCNCRQVNGTTSCSTCTRNYWSWDYVGSEKSILDTISLLGQEMSSSMIPWVDACWESTDTVEGKHYFYHSSTYRSSFSVVTHCNGGFGFRSDENGFIYDSNLNGSKKGPLVVVRVGLVVTFILAGVGLGIWNVYENWEKNDRYD